MHNYASTNDDRNDNDIDMRTTILIMMTIILEGGVHTVPLNVCRSHAHRAYNYESMHFAWLL